ncbi:MAG: hypothetical protein MI739_13810 [Bacteroidales bacterium]|nr:hypothetical protein [Bacteroidales bacterium]
MRKFYLLTVFIVCSLMINAQTNFDEINLLLIKSKYKEALKLCDEALNSTNDKANLYYLKAIINKQLYRFAAAVNDIEQALEIEPENIDYLNEYASILIKRNRKNKALLTYKTILELDKYHVNSGLYLSNHYMKNKKYEESKEILEKLYSADTTNSYFARNIGLAYIKLGKKKEAIFWLNKTLAIDSVDIKAFTFLSLIYSAVSKFDSSLIYINKAIACDPLNKDLYIQAAEVHVTRNHNFRAIPMYLKALEIDPNDGFVTRDLGFCYYKIKKFDKSKLCLLKAIRNSDCGLDIQANSYLGNIYEKENKLDSSIYYYNAALKVLKPDHNSLFDLNKKKAECYYGLDDYKNAIKFYEKALTQDVESFWITSEMNSVLINIAAIYSDKLNDKAKALKYLKRVKKGGIIMNKDYYKYAQVEIRKLKEEMFFEEKSK